MNWKIIATTILFSCAIVACSKQDDKAAAPTKQAQAKPESCEQIKDREKRHKCVSDKLFYFTTDQPTTSKPVDTLFPE